MKTPAGKFDVIVIGAGPAGSATAIRLARAGRRVALVERAAFPRRKVCGEFMSATNLGLLDEIGIGSVWRAAAGPEIRRIGLFARERLVTAAMPPSVSGGYGRALGRDRLDLLLSACARDAGATLFQPWQAVALGSAGGERTVRIASGRRERQLSAPLVVAAHGSWEPGRLSTHLDRPHRAGDLFGFKAHFFNARLPLDLMPLLLFPGGYGGMVWADGGRLSFSCCVRRDILVEARTQYGGGSAGDAVFRHVASHCRGVREALTSATLDGGWLAAGPIRPGLRSCHADDLFRAGNLAGESHPLIAEGISMALQSGWMLGGILSSLEDTGPASRARAGAAYSAAWRRQFQGRILAAGAFARLAAVPGGAAIAGPVVDVFPRILTFGARLSGKTKEFLAESRRVPL